MAPAHMGDLALMRHCIELARGMADYLVQAESERRVSEGLAKLTDADVKAIGVWAFNAVARTEPFDTDQKCPICCGPWPCADQRVHGDAVVALDILIVAAELGSIREGSADAEMVELERFLRLPRPVTELEAEERRNVARRRYPDAMRRLGL